jgi:CRISPR-associated protein Csm4
MKTYRFTLKPLGPWSTPWDADTIFGTLCWQVLRSSGEAVLGRFLGAYRQGSPHFILSSAFPEGWLPCPLSARVSELKESNVKRKRPLFVPEEQFRALITGQGAIMPSLEPLPEPVRSHARLHASIDRGSGTTGGEGNLFEVDEWCLNTSISNNLSLFVKVQSGPEQVRDLLEGLSKQGFGKKRSSGRGAFQLAGEPAPCEWMDSTESANGFVSLSPFIPAADDPTVGRWSLLAKYPKFSLEAPVSHPFKGRVVMLRAGSAFQTLGPVQPFYGRMIQGVRAEFPEAVHYALAFAVPIQWPSGATPARISSQDDD